MLDAALAAVRWAAESKSGLWLAVSVSPAPAQFRYRDTLSTPADTIALASPALMAWKAIRRVCRLEAQKRLMVAAGTLVQSGQDGHHACHVGAGFAAGFCAAQEEVVQAPARPRAPGSNAGNLGEGGLHHGGREVVGSFVLQGTFEGAADRASGSGNNDSLSHGPSLRPAPAPAPEAGRVRPGGGRLPPESP